MIAVDITENNNNNTNNISIFKSGRVRLGVRVLRFYNFGDVGGPLKRGTVTPFARKLRKGDL